MTERTNTPDAANGSTFVRPTNTDQKTEQEEIERLRAQLANERERSLVRDEHKLAEREHKAEHGIALDDLAERVANAKRSRTERYRDARDAVSLADLYRRAAESGTRAYIRSQIQGSAEMRALRVASVRKVSMLVGLPVLLAFAAWSTSGVQDGVVRVLNLHTNSFAWAASWTVEPAIITIVALIIIGRAVLSSSGGKTDWRATWIEWTAIGLSLALNILGGWPTGADWHGIVTALPHSIGPIGCATTAYLIGLFDQYVTNAEPWKGAPRLDDLNLVIARPNTSTTLVEANTPAANELTTNTEPREHLANEQPAIARTSTPNTLAKANTPAANDRTDHEHLTNELAANTDPSEHHVFVRPTIEDLVRPAPVRERRTSTGVRANGAQAPIDPQLIERLDTERPGWRTNLPSARELASVLGYSSSSTGNRIRRSLLVYVEQDSD